MTNRFFIWLASKLENVVRERNQKEQSLKWADECMGASMGSSRPGPKQATRVHYGLESNTNDTMNFQIYSANGGFVLEYSHYDHIKDGYQRRLHLIRDDENLGEDIAKVITLELLHK
jgi:hypothetical protein